MSNVRKSKLATRSSDAPLQLVSNRAEIWYLNLLWVWLSFSVGSYADKHSMSSFLCFVVLFHPGLMLSVTPSAFPAFLSARDPGKSTSVGLCLCVCVLVVLSVVPWFTFGAFAVWQCIINWWNDSWVRWVETKDCCSALFSLISYTLLWFIM